LIKAYLLCRKKKVTQVEGEKALSNDQIAIHIVLGWLAEMEVQAAVLSMGGVKMPQYNHCSL
jgi:hypothetical protein